MTRWTARILGILLLIVFMILMLNLQRRLQTMQDTRDGGVTGTTTTGT